MAKLILIVEDEKNQRQILKFALNKGGFDTEEVDSGQAALDLLSSDIAGDMAGDMAGHQASRFDLILLDMLIGEVSGKDVLSHVRENLPHLPVIILTGQSSVEHAVEAMREGAVDFISKPVEVDRLKISIENAFRMSKMSGEISRLSRKWSGQLAFDDLVGGSEAMEQAIALARKGANSNVPILLEGESGVGKEVFARAIQGESDRYGKPFVVVNCGAIPDNLVESILFGHEKGAFTGAMDRHMGKFLEADGGTLFLDEIGELPLEQQVKLLRVLQENEVSPIGSQSPLKVDVRLIFATNRHLPDMVKQGSFREDLFYRINIFPILLPPLRDRKDDIENLARHFLENICISEGCALKDISDNALKLLGSYHWPGNVRQLENALFRAIILSDHDVITMADFPQIHSKPPHYEGRGDRAGGKFSDAMTSIHDLSMLDDDGEIHPLQQVEDEMIRYAFHKYEGRMSVIARKLGLGRSTLYRKVSALRLD